MACHGEGPGAPAVVLATQARSRPSRFVPPDAFEFRDGTAPIARPDLTMVGALEPALPTLLDYGLVRRRAGRIELTDMARVMAEHFIGVERLVEIKDLVRRMDDAADVVAELECAEEKEP